MDDTLPLEKQVTIHKTPAYYVGPLSFDSSKYFITEVEDQYGQTVPSKEAYGSLYSMNEPDAEIELKRIKYLELEYYNTVTPAEVKEELKFHYKQVISLWLPDLAAGWNFWSEEILDLFLSNKLYRVLWGSGNCGKSAIIAACLYIKYRVNPSERLVLILSRFATESNARVYGYIKKYHARIPKSEYVELKLFDAKDKKEIRPKVWSDAEDKWVYSELHGIVSLPIKVNSSSDSWGDNLIGKHPTDCIIIALDEAQQLLAWLKEQDVFKNFLTNEFKEFHLWGNPKKIDYYDPSTYDLLFSLGYPGRDNLLKVMKDDDYKYKTLKWEVEKSSVRRFTMYDSPKSFEPPLKEGQRRSRIYFLAGPVEAADIVESDDNIDSENSPSFFAQVLGFPYLNMSNISSGTTIVSPFETEYLGQLPLVWSEYPTNQTNNQNFHVIGVDPAVTGQGDNAIIYVCRVGMMVDGRWGIDAGKECIEVKARDSAKTYID